MTPTDHSAAATTYRMNPSIADPGIPRARALLDASHPMPAACPAVARWLSAWLPRARGARPVLATETGRWLQHLIQASRAGLVVTLGTGDGLAALWLADALRRVRGGRSDRALIAFERDPATARLARDVLRRAGVSRHVDVRCDAPSRVLNALDVPIDLVLLLDSFDADIEAVLDPLLTKLRPGASLIVPGIARRPALATRLEPHCADDGPLLALRVAIEGGLQWLVVR